MNWFKHDADASTDAKIKKLLIKYGAEGYAIYFHCLELITGDIGENNITFELEHDAEIIADNLKIKGTADKGGIDIVNEIMKYIISLDLFQESNGHIFCFKLLKRLDSSMTSNTKLRSLITSAKEHHDIVMTKSCKTRREETRKDNTNNTEKPEKEIKHKYGEYNHVLLTDSQMISVVEKLGEHKTKYMIKVMDEAIEEKGNIWHISNFAMALLKWAKKDTSYKPPQQTTPSMPRLPRPPKCPTCGKPTIEYMYGGAGCKPCGVMFRYNDKWIREK